MAQDPQGCGAFPRLQHRAVALRESKLTAWSIEAGRLRVRLDAYVHVSQGRPGVDPGTAWELDVELVLEGAQVDAQPAELPLWLDAATATLGAGPQALLQLPADTRAPIRLDLAGEHGCLRAAGSRLTVAESGAPRFVERFPGASPWAAGSSANRLIG